MKMRAIDVLRNVEGHEDWDISHYAMSKGEAEIVIEALKLLIEERGALYELPSDTASQE